MNIAKRVGALESKVDGRGSEKVHRIVTKFGQSKDQALDEYGRDKIGPKDLVVIRFFVPPFQARSGAEQ